MAMPSGPLVFQADAAWNRPVADFALEVLRRNADRIDQPSRGVLQRLAGLRTLRETVAPTHLDALAALNDLGGLTTRTQYRCVCYALGLQQTPPRAGGLSNLRLAGLEAHGRPTFPKHTQEKLNHESPLSARRHILAWHAIRDLANRYVAAVKEGPAAASFARWLDEAKPKLPQAVNDDLKRIFPPDGSKPPKAVFGGNEALGRALLPALYVMNGNPKNLWMGDSAENSAIAAKFAHAKEAILARKDANSLLAAARDWVKAAPKTNDSLWWAGRAILDAAEDADLDGHDPGELLTLLRAVAFMGIAGLDVDEAPLDEKDKAYKAGHKRMGELAARAYQAVYGKGEPIEKVAPDVFKELLAYPVE